MDFGTFVVICIGLAILFKPDSKAEKFENTVSVEVQGLQDQVDLLQDKLDAVMQALGTDVASAKVAKREELVEQLREILRKEDLHGAKELTIKRLQEASGESFELCEDVIINSGLWSPIDMDIDRYAEPISH